MHDFVLGRGDFGSPERSLKNILGYFRRDYGARRAPFRGFSGAIKRRGWADFIGFGERCFKNVYKSTYIFIYKNIYKNIS
jgi:hypothetical protein